MPNWFYIILTKWSDFIVTFFGVLLGGFIAYQIAKYQINKDLEIKKKALLSNFFYECDYNVKILYKLQSFVVNGPNIDHLWSPAEVISKALQIEAWGEIIKAGILPKLTRDEQVKFTITTRTVMDVKRTVQVNAVNWIRVEEWHNHDLKENNQLLTQRKLTKVDFIRDATGHIDYSIKNLNESMEILKAMIDDEANE